MRAVGEAVNGHSPTAEGATPPQPATVNAAAATMSQPAIRASGGVLIA
jgi:hypothetical protein